MNASLIAFVVALIAALGLTVPVRQLALRVGMVDHPGPRKVHLQPIPLLGGLAIYCGVLVAVLVSIGGLAIYSGVLIALLASMGGPALTHILAFFQARPWSPSSASSTTGGCCITRLNCLAPCPPRP